MIVTHVHKIVKKSSLCPYVLSAFLLGTTWFPLDGFS